MYMRILRLRFSNHTAGVVSWVSLKLGKSYEVTSLSAVHASEQNDIIYGVRCHINFYLCCMFSHFSQSDYAARVRQLAQPARNVNSIASRIASRHSVSAAIAVWRQSWFKRSLSLLEYYCKPDNFFYLLLLRFTSTRVEALLRSLIASVLPPFELLWVAYMPDGTESDARCGQWNSQKIHIMWHK